MLGQPTKLPVLRNWYIDEFDQLTGQVYGDPRFEDGLTITTTRVVTWDSEKKVALTKNTRYELGNCLVKPEQKPSWVPNG